MYLKAAFNSQTARSLVVLHHVSSASVIELKPLPNILGYMNQLLSLEC